jgi:hypothetical protein
MKPIILPAALKRHGCKFTATGLELPADLTEAEWLAAGQALTALHGSWQWALGDWWAYGEHAYGDRKALVESDDWTGPEYQTCKNIAAVCRCFERSRRRDRLSFSHHAEVANVSTSDPGKHWGADEYLDWCLEPLKADPKARPRSVRELREEIARRTKPAVPSVLARVAGGGTVCAPVTAESAGAGVTGTIKPVGGEATVATIPQPDNRTREITLATWPATSIPGGGAVGKTLEENQRERELEVAFARAKEIGKAFGDGEAFGRKESAKRIAHLTRENEMLRAALHTDVVDRIAERLIAAGNTRPSEEEVVGSVPRPRRGH